MNCCVIRCELSEITHICIPIDEYFLQMPTPCERRFRGIREHVREHVVIVVFVVVPSRAQARVVGYQKMQMFHESGQICLSLRREAKVKTVVLRGRIGSEDRPLIE